MLDNLLVNVFGRSKKQSNSLSSLSSANSQPNQENENNDGFILMGQTISEQQSINLTTNEEPPPLYPSATILTNDMIRMGPSAQAQTSTVQSSSTSSTRLPYNIERSYSTPIDNLPFTPTFNMANDLVNTNFEFTKCFETIDRIGQYLSTPSQSEYNFTLENNILSESLLS